MGWRAISKKAIMTLCRRKKGSRFRRFASHLRYSTSYSPDFSLLLYCLSTINCPPFVLILNFVVQHLSLILTRGPGQTVSQQD